MSENETIEMSDIVVLNTKTTGNNCCDDSQGECDFDY
jgi:hypothetical protein